MTWEQEQYEKWLAQRGAEVKRLRGEVARLSDMLTSRGICPDPDQDGKHNWHTEGGQTTCKACGFQKPVNGCKVCGIPTFGPYCKDHVP